MTRPTTRALLASAAVLVLAVLVAPRTGASQEPYRIGRDDVLTVSVWDNKDTDHTVTVRPDGKISLPLLGEVHAGGLTVAELVAKLTEGYSKTIREAQVMVDIREIRSRPVYFLGALGKTGPLQLTQDLNLLQALAVMGGASPSADLEAAYVLRGTTRVPVDFVKLVRYHDLAQNIRIEPGDTIVVPVAESVQVQGDVKSAGMIKLTSDLTLLRALARAGGFNDLSGAQRITLLRGQDGKRESIRVNLSELTTEPEGAGDRKLQPDDVIVVLAVPQVVYVQGEVKGPGPVKLTKDLTVLKAIAQAGGLSPMAAGGRVTILRGEGVKRERIRVNVNDLMTEPEAAADIPLQRDDIIIVPQRLF